MSHRRHRWSRPVVWAITVSLASLSAATEDAEDAELIVAPGDRILVSVKPTETVEAAWNGGLLTPTQTVVAPTETGDHWLISVSRGATGVPSKPRWLRVRVDGTPPAIEITTEPEAKAPDRAGAPPGGWVPPGATARLRARDAVAGVLEVQLTAGSQQAAGATGATLTLPAADGAVQLGGTASDRVGNQAAAQPVLVRVDATPPALDIELEGPHLQRGADVIVAPTTAIVPRAEDAGSGLDAAALDLDGGPLPDRLPSGAHTATLTGTDRVGNRARAELGLVVDGEGPVVDWHLVAEALVERDGSRFAASAVQLAADATDAPAGLGRVTILADGTRQEYDPSRRFERPPVRLIAEDALGNTTETIVSWQLDTTPPALSLVTPDGRHFEPETDVRIGPGTPLRALASDDGSGVDRVETAHRQRFWYRDVRYRERDVVVLSRPGVFFVRARARDRLGNEGEASWRVLVGAEEERP